MTTDQDYALPNQIEPRVTYYPSTSLPYICTDGKLLQNSDVWMNPIKFISILLNNAPLVTQVQPLLSARAKYLGNSRFILYLIIN